MKTLNRPFLWMISAAVSAAGIAGCMTGQDKTTLDAITGASEPYVEAYIEYRGPQPRWAGPSNWVMHVVSKVGTKPEITAPSSNRASIRSEPEESVSARKPASQLLSNEEVREKLAGLATALNENSPGFHGCLYPIHVRMIRADGNVLDKEGCRGQSPWAKAVSDTVDFFMAADHLRSG